MGWLYCSSSRADLILHLKRDVATSTNLTPIDFSLAGNFLYALVDIHPTETRPAYKTILVFKLAGGNSESPHYRWGYKDMDESMGPYAYTCPLKFLDASTCDNPGAIAWREACRAEHAKKALIAKGSKSLKVGLVYTFNDVPDTPWFDTQGKNFQLSIRDGKECWRSIKSGCFIKAAKTWPLKEGYNPTLLVPKSE
jgi:hypothetical protein